MTDIGKLCERIYEKIEWQKLPIGMTSDEVSLMLEAALGEAIRDLFVVTGRYAQYPEIVMSYTEDGRWTSMDYDLLLDEELYVLCCAQIEILKKCRAQYNDLLGYTTNALSVTNADKPYTYMTGSIGELESQKRKYFMKMVRYSHLD